MFITYSATPSGLSVVSDLTSSIPGVLAGCGAAGECLSDTAVDVAAVGVAALSLLGSSTVDGDG